MTFPYLVFIFIATLSGVSAEGPTKEDIEKSYENIKPGEFVCYYDGSLCKIGEEYCSIKPRTCESIFPIGASKKEKWDLCSEILQKQNTEPGKRDSCIYYRGNLTIEEGVSAEGPTKEDIEKSYKNIKPGEFACYYDGSLCKLGEEYCSIKSRTCESIFPTSASEKEKCDFCSEIIQKRDNEPGIYDGCIYYRGIWAIGKDYGKSDDKSNDNTLGLALGLGLGLPTILAAAIIVYKSLNKKNISAPTHQTSTASGMDIGGDIDSKRMSEAKKENAINTVLDVAQPAAEVPLIKPSERQ